jgi:hypothetical protein
MNHAYWGPQSGPDETAGLLSEHAAAIVDAGCVVEERKMPSLS